MESNKNVQKNLLFKHFSHTFPVSLTPVAYTLSCEFNANFLHKIIWNGANGIIGAHTVIRFVWISAIFGTCTVVSVNKTLVEAKICTFTLDSTHFIFNKWPIYTYDGASAKFSTNSQDTDYSAGEGWFSKKNWIKKSHDPVPNFFSR